MKTKKKIINEYGRAEPISNYDKDDFWNVNGISYWGWDIVGICNQLENWISQIEIKLIDLVAENDWYKNNETIKYLRDYQEQIKLELKPFNEVKERIFERIDIIPKGMQQLFKYAIDNKVGVFGDE